MASRWRTVWATGESDDLIVRLGMAGPGVVVSADHGGALEARRADDGSLVAPPTYTGISGIRGIVALAAWRDGPIVRAATGAGSGWASYRWLQRWDLDARKEIPPAIDMNVAQVKHVDPAVVRGEQVLVVINRGTLEIRRTTDGAVIDKVVKHRETSRVVIGSFGREPIAITTSPSAHPELFRLEDLAAPEPLPGLAGGFVAAMDGDRLVCGSYAEPWNAWRTAWARDLTGQRLGPDVTGEVITSVAVADWPAVYMARADGTVSLVDLESGDELCPALRLPTKAASLAVAPGGDLIVGYGPHVARFRPPR
ncbi:hypothetical protein BDK92_2647 [Micromonospora pisi]|uniref:WD40 repeat protein n=1 Tax=Micromonospora pisi TaxID=589240 RepID=A0A495JIX0_9ACTN|nr:hypothetical protein [Micromonospora pisi]RKR88334.1 hypothetical protein BDK92_2647 [Micromonospora pisi]